MHVPLVTLLLGALTPIHSYVFVGLLVRPNVLGHPSRSLLATEYHVFRGNRISQSYGKYPLRAQSKTSEYTVSQETIRLAKLLKSRPFFDVGAVGGITCEQAFKDQVTLHFLDKPGRKYF
jgi:hypothetical protein